MNVTNIETKRPTPRERAATSPIAAVGVLLALVATLTATAIAPAVVIWAWSTLL